MANNFVQVNDFLYHIGVNDRDTQLFEAQWPIPFGVAYNSYLIKAEKTALTETVKITKVDDFVRNLDQALDGRDLDYLIVHHMEPDHSGSLEFIRKLYPNVTLVANSKTVEMLEAFYCVDPETNIHVVDEGDILDLGGRQLQFFKTPMVHWPESMVSYELNSKILFSQDIFGSFRTLDGSIYDDEIKWAHFADEAVRYYTNIVGKYSKMAQNALKKLAPVEISMICPIHGPIWRSNPGRMLELYKNLTTWQVEDGVVIAFGSMYGNTETMADYLGRALAREGVKNVQIFDVSKTHPSYVYNEIWKHRGVILGACTYNNDVFPPMKVLCDLLEENKMQNHTIGVFGSYSWSGGAYAYLDKFAKGQKKFEYLEDIKVEAKSSPKAADYEGLDQLAKAMAENLKSHKDDNVENLLQL